MKKFWNKLGLGDGFAMDIGLSEEEFARKLSSIVDKPHSGPLTNYIDLFEKGKMEYRGYVGVNSFKIRSKPHLFAVKFNKFNVDFFLGTIQKIILA